MEIFSKWNSNIFNTPCHLNKWKKSCHLLSRVLRLKRIWIHGEHKRKNESLGKSFYSLSFNFQKVSNSLTFSQSITQQTKQSIQIYLFIITFQNLEFWDVTSYLTLLFSRSYSQILLQVWRKNELSSVICISPRSVKFFSSLAQPLLF